MCVWIYGYTSVFICVICVTWRSLQTVILLHNPGLLIDLEFEFLRWQLWRQEKKPCLYENCQYLHLQLCSEEIKSTNPSELLRYLLLWNVIRWNPWWNLCRVYVCERVRRSQKMINGKEGTTGWFSAPCVGVCVCVVGALFTPGLSARIVRQRSIRIWG